MQNYDRLAFVNDNEPVQIQIYSGRHPVRTFDCLELYVEISLENPDFLYDLYSI